MTAVKKSMLIPGTALTCALVGLMTWVLRWRLLSTAVDEKGLLAAGHPLSIISWVLAVGMVLLAVLCFRKMPEKIAVPGSQLSAVLRALAMAIACILFWEEDLLGKAAALAAAVTAVVSLASLAVKKEKLPAAALDIPMLIFFLLCLLSRYQVWSAEPELQRYGFSLLALVCLMVATYQRSAVSLGLAKGRFFLASGCLGVFFAFAAGADPGFTALFLILGTWMFAELGTVKAEA